MLTHIHPKLPMRDKARTYDFYVNRLGFRVFGRTDFEGYLMLERDQIQIHFFQHTTLDPLTNDGQVYVRTSDIKALYVEYAAQPGTVSQPLKQQPWGQQEFSVLDPDHNLLTFGQAL